MTADLDPSMVPAALRNEWRNRDAGILAHAAGVWCQARAQAVAWRSGDRARMVVVWRKRGQLYVHSGKGEAAGAATCRPGVPLTTWGQLEALVGGLVDHDARRRARIKAAVFEELTGGGL